MWDQIIKVWNIKGLHHQVEKVLENLCLCQRFNSFHFRLKSYVLITTPLIEIICFNNNSSDWKVIEKNKNVLIFLIYFSHTWAKTKSKPEELQGSKFVLVECKINIVWRWEFCCLCWRISVFSAPDHNLLKILNPWNQGEYMYKVSLKKFVWDF